MGCAALHPEHAELALLRRRVLRDRKAEPEHVAGFGGVDDAVVPKPRGRIIGAALMLELREDRRLEPLLVLFRPGLAIGLEIVAPERREHVRGLLAAHDRNA